MANEQTNVLITPGRGIITFDKSLVNSSTITNTVSTTQIKYDHMGGLTFLTPLDTSSGDSNCIRPSLIHLSTLSPAPPLRY